VSGVWRCGKEEEHPAHEHWQGHCDGQPVDPALNVSPTVPIGSLYGATAHPRPWSWPSLTVAQAKDLREQLDRFVEHYNRTYVVNDKLLILGCWPWHPGLAHELAALYAQWVVAFCGSVAAEPALYWHDRWLPGFQQRLPGWYGVGSDVCRPGLHVDDWNPAAAKLKTAGHRPTSMDVGDAVRELVDNDAYLDGV
jgi:hypothetical protein